MILSVESSLAPGVNMALIGSDIVVLDLKRDAYTCLVKGGEHLKPLDNGRIHVTHSGVLADLIAAGWAVETPSSPPRPTLPPACDARPPRAGKSGQAVWSAGAEAWLSSRLVRQKSLGELVEIVRRSRPLERSLSDGPWRRIDRVVRTFETARPWLPDQGLCLQRTFILSQALARRGIAVDWMFGVRTWPFAAHCWLQREGVVIADDLDRIKTFTPIMVV